MHPEDWDSGGRSGSEGGRALTFGDKCKCKCAASRFDAFAGTSGQPAAYGFIHSTKVKDAQSVPVPLRGDVLASSNGNECTMVIRL